MSAVEIFNYEIFVRDLQLEWQKEGHQEAGVGRRPAAVGLRQGLRADARPRRPRRVHRDDRRGHGLQRRADVLAARTSPPLIFGSKESSVS